MYVCMHACMYVCMYVCMGLWCSGLVVSMFDFHRSDRGSNPGRGGEIFIMITTTLYCGTIAKCLKPYATGSSKPCEGNWKLFETPSVAELARCRKLS